MITMSRADRAYCRKWAAAHRKGKPTAEITREWKSFGLRNATLVLKTWGIGVQSQRALGYFDRDKGEMVETQSFYLVEEEPLVKPANKGKADKAA